MGAPARSARPGAVDAPHLVVRIVKIPSSDPQQKEHLLRSLDGLRYRA